MAVFCGVCGRRIMSAPENDGPWPVTEEWQGFQSRNGRPAITDSCEDCGAVLRAAVTKAALEIAARNTERIDAMKRDIAAWEHEKKRDEEERMEFERAWHAHRAAKTRG